MLNKFCVDASKNSVLECIQYLLCLGEIDMNKKKLTVFGLICCLLVMCLVVFGCDVFFNSDVFSGDGTKYDSIKMTINKWIDGKIIHLDEGGDGEQWFSFTATTSLHYIYVKFSTLTNLNAYLYDRDENIIGTYEHMYADSGNVRSFSRLVNKGEKYYIKVTQGDYAYGTSDTGSYWIAFNENNIAPK